MDSEQKYTEDSITYEIDEWFISQLKSYSIESASDIIKQIVDVLPNLPNRNGWNQTVAGVTDSDDPEFFAIEFLKQDTEVPILVDVKSISIDDYLDYILNKQSIKYYSDEKKINKEESSPPKKDD
tara:strand:+ start:1287 stop:1661 length:375 start_codon:yes stop_codon:yes gene_type:complete